MCVRAHARVYAHMQVCIYGEKKGAERERYISLAVMETQKRMIKVAAAFMYNTFP